MKISIITVCYNSQETIQRTIESVITQNYQNIEYIIIDGMSSDNTVNIIKKYQAKYPIKLISEKDKGIYDAMNKGVLESSCEWILFLNSDDYLYQNTALYNLHTFLNDKFDIVYGATEFRYKGFSQIREPKKINKNNIRRKMPFNHQSSATRKSWLINHPFDINYKLAADYEFLIYAYKNKARFKKVNIIIASFASSGASNKFQTLAIREYEKIIKKYKLYNFKTFIMYRLLLFKPLFKKLTPQKIKKIIYHNFVK